MNCPQRTDSAAEMTATGVRQVNSEELLLLLHDTTPTAKPWKSIHCWQATTYYRRSVHKFRFRLTSRSYASVAVFRRNSFEIRNLNTTSQLTTQRKCKISTSVVLWSCVVVGWLDTSIDRIRTQQFHNTTEVEILHSRYVVKLLCCRCFRFRKL